MVEVQDPVHILDAGEPGVTLEEPVVMLSTSNKVTGTVVVVVHITSEPIK